MRNFSFITVGKLLIMLRAEGLSMSRITFYRLEKKLFPEVGKTSGNWRVFTPEEVEVVKSIIMKNYKLKGGEDMKKNTAAKLANEQQPLGMGGYSLASRDKHWSEIKLSDKIERLRALLKSMVNENANLRSELSAIKNHTHNEEGEAIIVKRLKDSYGENVLNQVGTGLGSKSGNPDDVYI